MTTPEAPASVLIDRDKIEASIVKMAPVVEYTRQRVLGDKARVEDIVAWFTACLGDAVWLMDATGNADIAIDMMKARIATLEAGGYPKPGEEKADG